MKIAGPHRTAATIFTHPVLIFETDLSLSYHVMESLSMAFLSVKSTDDRPRQAPCTTGETQFGHPRMTL